METKVKKRKAFYCNVKALLLFLVIYGHLIETHIGDSDFFLWQYRFIYAVHMPLFAFLSGFFLKSEYDCLKQMRTAVKIYVPAQLIAMVVIWLTEKRVLSFFTPYWHLWYLMSLFFWAGICYFAVRIKKRWKRWTVLFLSILIACLCGYADGNGRVLSLSRTLYFLPFVLLGCFLPKGIRFAAHRRKGIVAGFVAIVLFVRFISGWPVELLYGADSFDTLALANGTVARLLCILVAAGLGWALLSLLPGKALSVSRVGVDTLLIYLLHGPLVRLARNIRVENHWFALLAPILAALIYLALYLIFEGRKKNIQIVS